MSAVVLTFFILFLQVMQIVNADAIVVKLNSGEYKTIHLSSIRPPRLEGEVSLEMIKWRGRGRALCSGVNG